MEAFLCGKFNFINLLMQTKAFGCTVCPTNEGVGAHNGGKYFIVLFHVSGHLEQFGGVQFFPPRQCILFRRLGLKSVNLFQTHLPQFIQWEKT